MESLLHSSSATYLSSRSPRLKLRNRKSSLKLSNGFSSSSSFSCNLRCRRKLLSISVEAKKKNKSDKEDTHSFVPRPDEATGPFPEAVLLKEKKVQEDGRLLPEFADAEEQELYEFLDLQVQSQLNVERMRHYEMVYLIHEKHAEEVASVNEKVQDFLREKKGKIWRLNDWGLRRLAYKIQKANNAHYMLMNFELEARWINDFKTMLDKDERVIRHLVMKRDEAITEDCPPPAEFPTLRAGMDDNDEEEDDEDYEEHSSNELDEDWDGEGEREVIYDDVEVENNYSVVYEDKKYKQSRSRKSTRSSEIEREKDLKVLKKVGRF